MILEPIATVRNDIKKPEFIKNTENLISEIVLHDGYSEGLFKIEAQNFIDVVFYFHQSDNYDLVTKIFSGETRGVFASRSPRRPNSLGVTTVKLLHRRDNVLVVSGLDAIDGTPVLDIKTSDFSFFKGLDVVDDNPVNNPRFHILKYISRGQTKPLLQLAGQIHGHYCPGLAMGVMAATYAMDNFRGLSDGMEDLLAVVETNNCFSDGVQFVTGCTFGNNALIFKDYGKNAVSLVSRDGKGIRVRGRNDIRDNINHSFPEFNTLFEKVVVNQNHEQSVVELFRKASAEASFGMLKLPFDELFAIENVNIDIPSYAPIEESLICDSCGEIFMASRGQILKNKINCNACLNIHHPVLDGHGIHCI